MRASVILTILSMNLPVQLGATVTAYSFLNFALGRTDKSVDDSKNIKGQINVSGLSVFH